MGRMISRIAGMKSLAETCVKVYDGYESYELEVTERRVVGLARYVLELLKHREWYAIDLYNHGIITRGKAAQIMEMPREDSLVDPRFDLEAHDAAVEMSTYESENTKILRTLAKEKAKMEALERVAAAARRFAKPDMVAEYDTAGILAAAFVELDGDEPGPCGV